MVNEYKEGGSKGVQVSMVNWWLAGVLKVVSSDNYQALNRLFWECVCVCVGGGMNVRQADWLASHL